MRPTIRSLVLDMYLRNINVAIIVQHLVSSGLNRAATAAAVMAVVSNV